MRAAITGEFPKEPKARCISWGAEEGHLLHNIQIGDREYELKRILHGNAARLESAGIDPVSGANKVSEKLLELLDVEKPILTNIVFVGQRDIEKLLFSGDKVTSRLAQRFFGIDKANQLESVLAKRVNTIVFDSGDRRLADLRTRRQELQTKVAELTTRLQGLPLPWGAEYLAQQEQRVNGATTLSARISAHKLITQASERLQNEINHLESTLATDRANVAKIDPAQIDTLKGVHEGWRDRNREIDWAERSVATAQAEFDKWHTSPPEPSLAELQAVERELEPIDSRRSQVSHDLQHSNMLLQNSIATPTCPTCMAPIDLTNRHKVEANAAALNTELAQLGAQRIPVATRYSVVKKAYDSAKSIYDQWHSDRNAAWRALQQAKASLTALGSRSSFTPDPDQFVRLRQQYDSLVEEIRKREESLTKTRAEFDKNQEQLKAFGQEQLMDANGQYLEVIDTTELSAAIAQQRQAIDDRNKVSSDLNAEQRSLTEVESQVAEAEKIEKNNRALQRFQRAVIRMRETFHPDGAPKILVSRNTARLESRVNQYLTMLDAEFHARVREGQGLEFDYIFPDGVGLGDDISVGQQVAMSWAFRLASMETFCSSVGFMTMDEPTATLDVHAKSKFNDLVDRLKEMAVTYGMQFFINAHDEELVRRCDQVIRLTPQQ